MFIYVTENKINKKKYVGQHNGEEDDGYIGSGKILIQSIKKRGIENFERTILERCSSKEELDLAEIKWIKHYRELGDILYNIAQGGSGGNTTLGYGEEEREKLSKTRSLAMKEVRSRVELETQRVSKFIETHLSKSKEEHDGRYNKVRGANNYQSTKVQTPLGTFNSFSEAAKAHGDIHMQTVVNRCENPKFYDWKIIDENRRISNKHRTVESKK